MKNLRVLVAGKISLWITTLEGFFYLFFNRISAKAAGIVLVVITFFFSEVFFPTFGLASTPVESGGFELNPPITVTTKSVFSEKTVLKTQVIPFSKKVEIDSSRTDGTEKIIQAGKNGQQLLQTTTTFHNGAEYSSETKIIKETPPQDEVVVLGISTGGELATPYGNLTYSKKLTVWATSYDSTCPGCNQTTATGLKAGYGVIAVDPKVIPLGTKVYIPDYDVAVAGDTGGSIKGNRIDVGFDSLKTSRWASHSTDIYLLTN